MKRVAWWLRKMFRRDRIVVDISPDMRRWDESFAVLSPGRSTSRRPGETWSEAMNRLANGDEHGGPSA